MNSKTARSIMRPAEAISLKLDMPLDKVSDHLTKHHLTGAPVVDEQSNLIGFVSEYDCLQQLMQSSYYCDNTSMAKDVMTTKLITTSPDLSLIDLASQMNNNKVNVTPVVENQKLVGVISRGDVMRELVKDLENCKVAV